MLYLDFLGMQGNQMFSSETHRTIPLLISIKGRLETAVVKLLLCNSDNMNGMPLALTFYAPDSFIGWY